MTNEALSLFISRMDFALITTMHILYPPLTIGLSSLLFYGEWRWLRTKDESWYRLVRFFEKLFIINFAAGVATGITMEMAFGILYGPFSAAAGPYFGQVLGYETISAFMYEAGFIGLMIFGWGKIGRKMHLFATFNVALSSAISAMWILVANSWMQTPAGVQLKDGFFQVVDWGAALLNPNAITAFPHMLLAAFEVGLCFVISVSAWFVLNRKHVALFGRSLGAALLALVVVAPLQVWMGDELGRNISDNQPAALAAMEGHYHTNLPDGSPDTRWNIVAWPNAKGDDNAWAISVPHVLSLLEKHSWNARVTGLDDIAVDQRPPVVIPFYSFRVMSAAGAAIMLLAFWGGFLMLRRKFTPDAIVRQRLFLWASVATGFLPYISIWCGWWTREVGRQPWVVYGKMTTAEGVSHMSVDAAVFWFVGYTFFELVVWGSTWYFFAKLVRQGPDLTSPVAADGHQMLGSLERKHAPRGGDTAYQLPL